MTAYGANNCNINISGRESFQLSSVYAWKIDFLPM